MWNAVRYSSNQRTKVAVWLLVWVEEDNRNAGTYQKIVKCSSRGRENAMCQVEGGGCDNKGDKRDVDV
jgi:hypothetical protein